jgi:hypothetical protein
VEVELGLNAVTAALQLAHGSLANVLAVEAQGIAIPVLDCVDVVIQALGQYVCLSRSQPV